ncbi:MAG: FHA domain-containing protein, partial [Thermoanaerobaculia bacterium]
RALGDGTESWIRTIPREGYRWEAAVARERDSGTSHPAPRAISYRLVLDDREVELTRAENIVGRDPEAVLWIDHTSVSRHHAKIRIGEKATLEDLQSKNGTYLRGEKISCVRELVDKDEIRIGPVSMIFRVLSRVRSTETEEKAGRP